MESITPNPLDYEDCGRKQSFYSDNKNNTESRKISYKSWTPQSTQRYGQ